MIRYGESRCFSSDHDHGARCFCGRPAKWHVNYGSGCGHVCNRDLQTIARRKRSVAATALERAAG